STSAGVAMFRPQPGTGTSYWTVRSVTCSATNFASPILTRGPRPLARPGRSTSYAALPFWRSGSITTKPSSQPPISATFADIPPAPPVTSNSGLTAPLGRSRKQFTVQLAGVIGEIQILRQQPCLKPDP